MHDGLHLTDPAAARDASFVKQVKAALGLPPTAQLQLQNAKQGTRGEWIVNYTAALEIKLESAELGAANGVVVDEHSLISLRFDKRGTLVSSHVEALDKRHLQQVRNQIRRLVAANEIYVPAPGEPVDRDALRAQRKPWYIATDERGCKRLKRAYIA